MEEYDEYNVKLAIIGVGGAGCNLINRLHNAGTKSATTIAVNTDALHLNMIGAQKKMLIGKGLTKGLGAGGYPEVGAKAAEMSKEEIIDAVSGYHMVFVAYGMGGGTGGGAGPVIARIAREQGALVVGFATYPFALERSRKQKADWSFEQLQKSADSTIIVENDRLLSYVPNLPVDKALELIDNIAANVVKGIADTINIPSLINLDFADIKTILGGTGTAVINIGYGSGVEKIDKAIKSTVEHPLLNFDREGAKSAMVQVVGDGALTIEEATRIGGGVTDGLDEKANVIFGARITPDMRDSVRVISITTGVTPRFGSAIKLASHSDASFLNGLENIV